MEEHPQFRKKTCFVTQNVCELLLNDIIPPLETILFHMFNYFINMIMCHHITKQSLGNLNEVFVGEGSLHGQLDL